MIGWVHGEECVDWLRRRGAEEVGLVGHSRGGVTVSQLEGDFCRVNIAGFQPPPVDPEDTFREEATGPMLIICGAEDEVCTRQPLSMDYVQDTVRRLRPDAECFYPEGASHFNVLNPQVVEAWQSLLGLAGALAPASEPAMAQLVARRVADFMDAKMGETTGSAATRKLHLQLP
eukprot:Skav214755  [mRNA]  locus=scaffold1230:34509:36841:+ [translate_table: standard]